MFILRDFKRVVTESRLTKIEIASIYGVARQTVYQWLEGQLPRDGSIADRMAFTITNFLLHAMHMKKLPLPAQDPKVRKSTIAGIQRLAQNLKPAAPRASTAPAK